MADFPILKTGAVAQYPAQRAQQRSTQTLRFVDGKEQRFRQYGKPLRRWVIQLDLLDEAEMATLEEFFLGLAGQSGHFSFTDPWDGTKYADCSLGGDEIDLEFDGEMRGKTSLVVRENRT